LEAERDVLSWSVAEFTSPAVSERPFCRAVVDFATFA